MTKIPFLPPAHLFASIPGSRSRSEAGRGNWHHRGERGQNQVRCGLSGSPWSRSCSGCISSTLCPSIPSSPSPLHPAAFAAAALPVPSFLSPLASWTELQRLLEKAVWGRHSILSVLGCQAQQDWGSPNPESQCQQCWAPHRDLCLTPFHIVGSPSGILQCLHSSFDTHS